MAISQEGGTVVSWWLRANRWGKNLLEKEGGGVRRLLPLYSGYREEIIFRSRQKEKAFFPRDSGSVPYHSSCRYLANTRIQISNLHTLLPRSFFFFLSFFLEFLLDGFLFFRIARAKFFFLDLAFTYESRIFATLKNKNSRIKFSWKQFLIKSRKMNLSMLSLVR